MLSSVCICITKASNPKIKKQKKTAAENFDDFKFDPDSVPINKSIPEEEQRLKKVHELTSSTVLKPISETQAERSSLLTSQEDSSGKKPNSQGLDPESLLKPKKKKKKLNHT